DLAQREAERLAAVDERESPPVRLRVLAVAGRRARRLGEDAPPLVEPDRLDVDAGRTGQLADRPGRARRGHARLNRWSRPGIPRPGGPGPAPPAARRFPGRRPGGARAGRPRRRAAWGSS